MKAPAIKTPLPGPNAARIVARDQRVVSTSYTRDYPFVMARGDGAVVEDVDGNLFIDCAAGIAVTGTGHSHPDVVRAIEGQARKYLHMSGTDFYYEPQVELAETLAGLVPIAGAGGQVRSFFGNSGTEAVEAAIKLARYASKRFNVIAFLGSFHGRTLGALSATSSKALQRRGFGPMMPGVFHAPFATCYRCPVGLRPETCQAECLGFVEDQLFVHLVSPDEVAAVLVEPIQGEGGYLVPARVFHQRLRELTSRHGILLVADEVQTGMGRTGKMFACEHFDVEPDIMTLAKGIASGMPLGVCSASADVMSWPPGAHASTFGGNPVSAAAALATIRLLQNGIVDNAAAVGAHMLDRLRELMDRHPIIGDVRGKGLMIGVELVRDRATKERATEERNRVVQAMFQRGVLALGAGRNAIRFAPPLVLTIDQADSVVDIFDQSLAALST
ncbi:MAG TPA: acetyl ornithine aminotransferase family protein [Vicinamibacterales bacterium]|nr:acetyl ornithine aminotransferase family protein [Vicinamibacterales bacterium]